LTGSPDGRPVLEEPAAAAFVGSSTAVGRARAVVTEVAMEDRLTLTVDEAAQVLGISRALAYELVARGELPSLRLGRRIVIPRRALELVLSQATPETA
jgi:excisionase family DNA binding protein